MLGISFKGNQVEVHKMEGGGTTWVHITDVKYILLVNNVIAKLPNYQNFGQKTTLQLNPDKIPNLHLELCTTLNMTPTLTTQQSVTSVSINLLNIIPWKITTQEFLSKETTIKK